MAVQTKTQIAAELAANFGDGGAATAAEFRAFLTDIIDSVVLNINEDDIDLNGKAICFSGSNTTGSTITKGTPVYINGASNSIAPADSDGPGTMPCVGIAAEDILTATSGLVAVLGTVSGINTSTFTADDTLYVSATAGALTNTIPATGQVQPIARVITVNDSTGTIFVSVFQAGTELANLTNTTTTVGGDLMLFADASASNVPIARTVTNFLADHGILTTSDKTGADAAVVSGTAGTNGDLAIWNGDGDLVDGPTPPSGSIVGTTDTQTLTNKTLTAPKIAHPITTDADNYTLVAGDQSGIVIMSGGSANQLTIPTNASVAFPLGTKVEVWSTGAGTTTIAGDTGVTLQGNGGSASAGSCDIQTQYGGATLTKIATDTWIVGGDIDTVA